MEEITTRYNKAVGVYASGELFGGVGITVEDRVLHIKEGKEQIVQDVGGALNTYIFCPSAA